MKDNNSTNTYHVFGMILLTVSFVLGSDNHIAAPGIAVAGGLCIVAGAIAGFNKKDN